MPQQLFVFIQLEFPLAIGPADGRYLIRREDGEPERVVVLGTLEAGSPRAGSPGSLAAGRRPRRLLGSRRTLPTGPEPAPLRTSRVTVIDPVSLSADMQARSWLAELNREREVEAAVATVNRVIHTHRIAAADPYVHEVSPEQALVIRAGWGEGEQVADGRWLHARALPWHSARRNGGGRRRDRSWALRPQERLAALLGARETILLCEEVVLRARQDVDHGRLAHGALELDRAYALAVPELRGEGRQDLAIRLAEIEQLAPGVQTQAQAALAGADERLDEASLEHALGRLEAILRARTAGGLDG
jgi:hypothetical protein